MRDPAFVAAPLWWRSVYWRRRRIPICPRGHKLRRAALGQTKELKLPWAFLRGILVSCLLLAYGMVQDRRTNLPGNHLFIKLSIALGLFCVVSAFAYAWSWAGVKGPVNRLCPRACGMALGYAVPVVLCSHALYFRWLDAFQLSFCQKIQQLFALALR